MLLTATTVHALSEENVLVLVNNASPESVEIGNYYKAARPGVTVLGLDNVPVQEDIPAQTYLDVIRPQVLAGLNDDIDAIVTTKGMPLRIYVNEPNPGNYDDWRGNDITPSPPLLDTWWKINSSLEGELTNIDNIDSAVQMGDQAWMFNDDVFGQEIWGTSHHAQNTFYQATGEFDYSDPDVVTEDRRRIVTRLDGYTVDDVKGMIDRSLNAYGPGPGFRFIVDGDPDVRNTVVPQLADELNDRGVAHDYNNTDEAITATPRPELDLLMGYLSTGVNDDGTLAAAGHDWIETQIDAVLAPGATFGAYESFNASTFNPEKDDLFGQGKLADWIARGGTAAYGNVREPVASVSNVTNEDILFASLLDGDPFGVAYMRATPQASFVTTAIGDPLMVWHDLLPGDANLDGVVDSTDVSILSEYFNQPGGWLQADFDGDGFVDSTDVSILSEFFGMTASSFAASAAAVELEQIGNEFELGADTQYIPEPSALLWFGIGGLSLLRRRCRAA